MIFANSKMLFLGGLLSAVWRPGVLAENDAKDDASTWIESARKLQADHFLKICGDVFMSPDHMQQQSYLMSDFADEVSNLCLKIAPEPDQGTCQKNDFNSLDASLQTAFFRHAAQHMGSKMMPMETVMAWGDAGYIISNKTAIEQEMMRNDLCVEIRGSIGDEFLENIPVSELPDTDSHALLPETQPIAPATNNENDDFSIVHVEKEEGEILSISAIVAICCAVAAVIALFFYYEARRRNRARINRMSRFNNEGKGFQDEVIHVNTSSSIHPIEEVSAAINDADWDGVYRLASQLAENDHGLSLQNPRLFKGKKRRHLDVEDRERAKTLDDLAANGDWTGLAVTAALYAGETSGSSVSQSDEYSYYTDDASVERDVISDSGSDDVEGQQSMERMVSKLSKALNGGNWQQVTKYANLIKDEKNAGNSFDTDSQIILRTPSSSSSVSSDVSKTEMSKKQTIAKLMRAGKWKGVSIMANMYEMESKQVQSSSVRPYPPSPNHPYSDRRSILKTKELRHSDRVQENIVGFRRDP